MAYVTNILGRMDMGIISWLKSTVSRQEQNAQNDKIISNGSKNTDKRLNIDQNNNLNKTDIGKSTDTQNIEYPLIMNYVDFNTMAQPTERFTDEYKTGTPYSLRQLLVLIWWLKLKKGRKTDATTPKYFITLYTESVSEITQTFFEDGVLFVDEDGFVRATPEGKQLRDKFINLWEIHSKTNAILDDVYENWNLNQFEIDQNEKYIKRLLQENNYYNDLVIWDEANNESSVQDGIRITHNLNEIDKLQRQNEALRAEMSK